MAQPGFVRFLYNQNPFYLISAAIVLFGCQTSLDVTTSFESVWILSTILVAVTLLLSATAFLIVRFGRVWDDARSIFMVLLLMFFAISISFDRLCITNANLAITMLLGGFCFLMCVTEGLLWSLKIRFPLLFRLPYYLLSILGFAYPLMFAAQKHWYDSTEFGALLLAFPMIAAVFTLSLIPAIRKGSSYVNGNGTPWTWPLFPWSIFVLILVGICGRSLILCLSFETSVGLTSIFGSYFLVPIFLAVIVLLLEVAIVQRSERFQHYVLLAAFIALPLSLHWFSGDTYDKFANQLTSEFCSPLFATILALSLLYVYAIVRGVDKTGNWLSCTVICFLLISPSSNDFSIEHFSAWPVFLLSVAQFVFAVNKPSTFRFVCTSLLFSVSVATLASESFSLPLAICFGFHVCLLSFAATAVYCTDENAARLNVIVAATIAALAIVASSASLSGFIPSSWAFAEIALLTILALSSWNGRRDWIMLVASATPLLACSVLAVCQSLESFGTQAQKKLISFLLVAAVCFAIGIMISLLKGGLAKQVSRFFHAAVVDVKKRFVLVEKPVHEIN